MPGTADLIPPCPRPVAQAIVFDRDGLGDQRRPYCREHAALIKNAMGTRNLPYVTLPPVPTDTCYAWKDV